MRIAVGAATSQLGRLVVAELIERGVAPGDIVAVTRRPAKAEPLAALGVEVRAGDYGDLESMRAAFADAQRVLVISATQEGRRVAQHANAIDAAILAGAELLAYTSVLRAREATLSPVAPDHAATEQYLEETQAPAVVLRNGFYTENYLDRLRTAIPAGVLVTGAGAGVVASAARRDFAAAAAVVLTTTGHEGRRYELAGDSAWTMHDLARAATEVTGTPVEVREVTREAQLEALHAAGVRSPWAEMFAGIDASVSAGEQGVITHELSRLIGRPTTPMRDTLAAALSATGA